MNNILSKRLKVLIKGGGDLASGVAFRLKKAGFTVALSEKDKPLMVRRTVSYGEAVYKGEWEVEGYRARFVQNKDEFENALQKGLIPVFTADKFDLFKSIYSPDIVVDGRMMKKINDTNVNEASVVIGLGPGFTAGENVHAVVETKRGHYLGRVIYEGSAIPNTGIPGSVKGFARERVVYAPCEGEFLSDKKIGDEIQAGEVFGMVDSQEVRAKITGIIRGQIYPGLKVKKDMKIGDIDPRGERDHCFTISDKALAVGGGVLEAILYFNSKLSD